MPSYRRISIGWKIVFSFISLWLPGAALLISMSYLSVSRDLLENIRTRVLDYAALASMSIPAGDHAQLREARDEGTEAYARVVSSLRKVHAFCTDSAFVYTVRKNGDGKIMFVGDSSENEEDASHLGDIYEEATPLLLESSSGISMPTVEKNFYTDQWGTFLSAYAPIFTPDGTFDGLIGVDISLENFQRETGGLLRQQLVIFTVITLILILVAIALSRNIIVPIGKCVSYTGRLAEGDFSNDIDERFRRRRDEIGDLTRMYHTMAGNMRNLLGNVNDSARTVASSALELQENMNETAGSVRDISERIDSVRNRASVQSDAVQETRTTMERIIRDIENLNGHIERQSAEVVESSSAVEQMIANIGSVTRTLEKNAENVSELKSASESGRDGLGNVSTIISRIAGESEGMLEISMVIQEIAGQTNILSMNAAIEAAHAGEAGRGFAVVAEEIRKLAENSASQAKTISDVLNRMKESIDRVSVSASEVSVQFEKVVRTADTVHEQENEIRNAMAEQHVGSRQILEAVNRLNGITVLVKEGSAGMISGSRDVISEMNRLSQGAVEINHSMNEMAAGTERINAAVDSVNGIGRKTGESIERLMEEVERFKTR